MDRTGGPWSQYLRSVLEVAPSQAFKVTLLLAAVVNACVRVAAEPSIPVRPVFVVWIAFLAAPTLCEFSRDPLDCPLGVFTALEVKPPLHTSHQAGSPHGHDGTRLLEDQADDGPDFYQASAHLIGRS